MGDGQHPDAVGAFDDMGFRGERPLRDRSQVV
jgi:hypothetical protein